VPKSHYGAAVVAEFNGVVGVRVSLRIHYHADQRLWLFHTINHHASAEKPVARVLAVALSAVE